MHSSPPAAAAARPRNAPESPVKTISSTVRSAAKQWLAEFAADAARNTTRSSNQATISSIANLQQRKAVKELGPFEFADPLEDGARQAKRMLEPIPCEAPFVLTPQRHRGVGDSSAPLSQRLQTSPLGAKPSNKLPSGRKRIAKKHSRSPECRPQQISVAAVAVAAAGDADAKHVDEFPPRASPAEPGAQKSALDETASAAPAAPSSDSAAAAAEQQQQQQVQPQPVEPQQQQQNDDEL
jgi:hypothetical protein